MQKETTYTPTPELELLAQLLANGPVYDVILENVVKKYEPIKKADALTPAFNNH